MDELLLATSLLETFDEITKIEPSRSEIKYISFSLFDHDFLMLCPEYDIPSSEVTIFAVNETLKDYPHIGITGIDVPKNKDLPEGNYKTLCLYESGSVVMSLLSFEEKIIDAIERLKKLLSLTKTQIEKELQKEFLYYWNEVAADIEVNVYLGDASKSKKLNVYLGKDELRCIAHGIQLNDKDKKVGDEKYWKHQPNITAIYIPIIDNRDIVPPTNDRNWTDKDLLNIVFGKQISHVSKDTYAFLSSEQVKTKAMLLLFGMKIKDVYKIFTIRTSLRNAEHDTIINKLRKDIANIQPIKTKRQDYYALSEAIGNRVDLLNKRILIVGAGSLGSYIAAEIVKNGINKLTIYDGDRLEPDNILRWTYGGFGQGLTKPHSIKLFLEFMHPEIHINAVGKDMDDESLGKEIENHDLIIFTIGSSDKQLRFNNLLRKMKCNIPAIYAWIEAGGEYSHLLKVDYEKKGCFQCLYTSENGKLINNKVNILKEEQQDGLIIRNGCGGTRAPYGTSVLLRTTSVLLNILEDIFDNNNCNNYLMTVSKEMNTIKRVDFVEGTCECCGNSSSE